MRKTFDELIEAICWETSLVGDKASFQDENSDPDECYWVSVKEVKELLRLVREKTLSECNSVDTKFFSEEFKKYSNGLWCGFQTYNF